MSDSEGPVGPPRFLPECRWNLVQFGLVCSYTMGITAMWKFPYLVYKHTGKPQDKFYFLAISFCLVWLHAEVMRDSVKEGSAM